MYTPVSTSSHRRTNRVNVPVYVCLPVCVHTVRSKLYTCVALQSHCWASIFSTGGTFYSLSVIALSPPTATIYPMLPLEEGSLFEFPHPMPTPTSPFFCVFLCASVFWEGFSLSSWRIWWVWVRDCCYCGPAKPFETLYMILVCTNKLDLTCLQLHHSYVCCLSARLVMFPGFAIICSPLCLLKRSPGIYHEVLIAM